MNSVSPANNKLVIYQIFTRLFGNQNSTNKLNGSIVENGVGKFNDITTTALKSLKDFGVTHVWYTGVIEHATMTDYSEFGIENDHPSIVKGRAGSPYAIKDYYDVDPDLAVDVKNRMQEFQKMVDRTHAEGLKVVIDFVPNHVSRQYKSDQKPKGVKDFGEGDDLSVVFDPQNNFYYLPKQSFEVPEGTNPPVAFAKPYQEFPAKATGNDVFNARPSINDWYETIKLNYGVDYPNGRVPHFDPIPSTWMKMRDILAFWAEKGVDAFRCDMAEMVPVEFWGWVIPEIQKSYPEVVFIAEIYNPNEYVNYIKRGKFTYLYDKVGLYDALRRLMEGNGTAEDITKVWQNESGTISEHMLRFLENHDEQRIASDYFAKDPFVAIPAMTLSATLHTGPLMIYHGQEVGVNPTKAEGFQGNDGRTTIFDYWGVEEFQNWVNGGKYDGGALSAKQTELRNFYQSLNHFATSTPAIHSGQFYDLQFFNINGQSPNYDKTKIYSYLRYVKDQQFLCVYNFDRKKTITTSVRIPSHALVDSMGLSQDQNYQLAEAFPGTEFSLAIQGSTMLGSGIPITLPPTSVKIIQIKPR